MKTFRAQSGPFVERPYFEESEMESIAIDELRSVDLLPTAPGPIRVDRFIEKRFGIVPEYETLQADLLGYTRFGSNGAEAVVVSRSLAEEDNRVAERRLNSTLAHEAGHMLLHGRLFALQKRARSRSLFEDDLDEKNRTILCRSGNIGTPSESTRLHRYDGQWWEYQANRMIGTLLAPRLLVSDALDSFLIVQGQLGLTRLDPIRREEAVLCLADVFDVNPAVARIRVAEIFPVVAIGQLTL